MCFASCFIALMYGFPCVFHPPIQAITGCSLGAFRRADIAVRSSSFGHYGKRRR